MYDHILSKVDFRRKKKQTKKTKTNPKQTKPSPGNQTSFYKPEFRHAGGLINIQNTVFGASGARIITISRS